MPLVLFFLIFQVFWLRLPRAYVASILKGTLLAACGLLLFLQGVQIGLLPFGQVIGQTIGALPQKWSLAPLGFLLGFVTTWGEPSVRILADQVEKASSGAISERAVILTICVSVGMVVGLGAMRIAFDIPLLYILIPGYAFAIVIMWFGDEQFISIAVDASGVATGPMANTFLLAMGLGISSAMVGQDPLIHGLGLMALIALAPIISIIILGFFYRTGNQPKGADEV